MFEGPVAVLVIFSGIFVHLAVDAWQWQTRQRFVLLAAALPLTALSVVGLWMMVASPHWLRNPAWHGAPATGFGPDWACNEPDRAGPVFSRPGRAGGGRWRAEIATLS